ncbi:MAG: Gfo/Idh/MocA family oxidoreductase [Pseudomonadota bacterium]
MAQWAKLAVVGLGLIGRRHVAAIAQSNSASLCAVVDPSPEAKADAANLGCTVFDTLGDMVQTVRPDGVIIASPTPLHTAQGLWCIDRGCPVLIEKPLAVTAADGERIVSAASAAGVPVLVGHHRRHNPLIAKARAVIAEGLLGDIRAVHAQCWFYKPDAYFDAAPWRKQVGAGPISVNLVHDVDLLRHLCGEITHVQAQSTPSYRGYDNEDVAAALLRFAGGAIGTLTLSDAVVSPWSWELTSCENPVYPPTDQSCYLIGGSRASLSLPDLRLWSHGKVPDWWSPISATTIIRDHADPLVNQIAHFAAVIAGEASPLVSADEGAQSLRVIEAIQQSAATGHSIDLTPSSGGQG